MFRRKFPPTHEDKKAQKLMDKIAKMRTVTEKNNLAKILAKQVPKVSSKLRVTKPATRKSPCQLSGNSASFTAPSVDETVES